MTKSGYEIAMDVPERSEKITQVAEFLQYLVGEKEKWSAAVHEAKSGLRNDEVLIPNGGINYRYDNEGN